MPASISSFVCLHETNKLLPELPLYKLQNFNHFSLSFSDSMVKILLLNRDLIASLSYRSILKADLTELYPI
jgi:hypothetical protein